MRAVFTALGCFLLCAVQSSAQSSAAAVSGETPVAIEKGVQPAMVWSGQGPVAPAKIKTIEIGLGYSYMMPTDSQSKRVGLQGADASFTIGFSRFGVRADVGYVRAGNVLDTGRHSDVLSYLIGPVFRPVSNRNYEICIHALLGGARMTGPTQTNGGIILVGGWATSYAWAAGGEVKYWLSDTLAIGTGADCLRTAYFDPSLRLRGQINLRTTATMIFYFGSRSGKHRRDSR
ncbi:MAG TPA: hypothetical protein VEI26_01725 [Terriglobales bacterium]|nr:hypothetical protein [Terriglobales bacterium]